VLVNSKVQNGVMQTSVVGGGNTIYNKTLTSLNSNNMVSYGAGNSQVGAIDSRSASRDVNKNNNYVMHMVNEYG
jgi:hypothetical protein